MGAVGCNQGSPVGPQLYKGGDLGKLGKFEYSHCMLHSIVSELSSLGEIMEYLAMQENIPCSCWHALKDLQVKLHQVLQLTFRWFRQ